MTEIGERAFYEKKLLSVSLPEGLTSIGEEAFPAPEVCPGFEAFLIRDNPVAVAHAMMNGYPYVEILR